VIMTDEWQAYPKASSNLGISREKHKTVNYRAKVYVEGDITRTASNPLSLCSSAALLVRGIKSLQNIFQPTLRK
jgi:hypothetical protein